MIQNFIIAFDPNRLQKGEIFFNKLKDCFEKKFLVRTRPEPELAKKSLKRGLATIEDVPKALKADLDELAEQRLYQSVFHGVKALLYKDGIKERSHICVSLYFKETYQKFFSKDLLTLLDRLRDVRHESQYGLDAVAMNSEQIQNWLAEAEQLLKVISQLLKS